MRTLSDIDHHSGVFHKFLDLASGLPGGGRLKGGSNKGESCLLFARRPRAGKLIIVHGMLIIFWMFCGARAAVAVPRAPPLFCCLQGPVLQSYLEQS